MKELIKITEQNGNQAVSARELYDFLGFDSKNWSRWYQKNIESNEFALENTDYQTLFIMKNGNETKDFALTIDFAKKISMMARTDKGEEARQYFLECERKLKNPVATLSRIDLARMVIEAEEEKERLLLENKKLQVRSDFVDKVFETKEYIKGSQVCKILNLGYGVITFYKKLREMGIFFNSTNEPKQELVNKGYITLKETMINDRVQLTPYFSQKGLAYIAKKFGVVIPETELVKIK